jgi:DEAD/DEAH box helicase domain-containing protein
MIITIVKQMERVDAGNSHSAGAIESEKAGSVVHSSDSLAGNGTVTVKREVHGYKKLSPVTRAEISRSEISLPPMEFDTYAVWIDAEATELSPILPNYDEGVHALSHALLAVAPLFVPCSSSDIDCDHSVHGCTRVMLFDVRAGGAGTCSQLWKFFFTENGLLDSAIELLESCSSCDADARYDGGCPACLHAASCLKFNQNLSRKAALFIAQRMSRRLKATDLYKKGKSRLDATEAAADNGANSPRRRARAKALRNAKDLTAARDRQIVVGRPSWPLDEGGEAAR